MVPEEEAPRRKGLIESIKSYAANVLGATRSRVDDFSAEVEYRSLRLLWMVVWSLVGLTSLCLAAGFAVLTVIFGFHLPPKYAFGIPALIFFVLALISLVMFQKTRLTKRRPRQ